MGPPSPNPIIAQLVKHLPAMWETWVQFLGWEVPLEKEMATYSSILAWRIPWTVEPGRLQFMGHQESDMTKQVAQSCLTLGDLLRAGGEGDNRG